MRVLFMGTPWFARIVLEYLLAENFPIVGLVVQPDKPFGRHRVLKSAETKAFLRTAHPEIPIFTPTKCDPVLAAEIQNLRPDFIVVVAYGKILPPEILKIAPCLNLHGSLLPAHRGASPIQEMILQDAQNFGVTVIKMAPEMDSGPILATDFFAKERYWNAVELGEKLAVLGAALLARVLRTFPTLTPTPQDPARATYCQKITKENGRVGCHDAKQIFLQSLAYFPWPGVFLPNDLKLFGVGLAQESGAFVPGEILAFSGEKIVLGCARGALEIAQIQAPGKQKIAAKTFVCGRRWGVGDRLF